MARSRCRTRSTRTARCHAARCANGLRSSTRTSQRVGIDSCAPPPSLTQGRCGDAARAPLRHRSRSARSSRPRPSRSRMSISEVSRWPTTSNLVDGEAEPRGHRLGQRRDRGRRDRRRRGCTTRSASAVAELAGKARRSEARRRLEPAQHARRLAQEARQHEAAAANEGRPRRTAACCPAPPLLPRLHRKHDASSTIQLNSSPNDMPRLRGDLGHQRRRRHAWLGVDLEPDEFAILRWRSS